MAPNKLRLVLVCILAFLSFEVTISNLGFKKSFVGDDAVVKYLYPDLLQKNVWSTWNDNIFPGISNVISTNEFIFTHFILFVYLLGFTDVFLARLFFFLFFFLSSLGIFYLFQILHNDAKDNTKARYIASFFAALVYAFNYFTSVEVSFPLTNYHITYCLFPWIFYLFALNYQRRSTFSSLFTLSILLTLFISGNPANTLSSLILISIWALLFTAKRKLSIVAGLVFCITTFFLISYSIFPLLSITSSPYVSISLEGNQDSLRFNSVQTSFINLFRFQGFHSAETFLFNKLLQSSPIMILSSFCMLLLLVTNLRKKYISRFEMFLYIVFIVNLFLAKGIHGPYAGIFKYIFDNVSVLQMFRATYTKFMPLAIFSTAILIGIIIEHTLVCNLVKFNKYLLSTILILLLLNAWPLLSGKSVRKFHLSEIPDEYNELREFFSTKQLDFAVLSIPQLEGSALQWGKDNYYAGQFYQDSYMLGRPVWNVSWFNTKLAKYYADSRNLEAGIKISRRYGIKYVLLHKDIPEDYDFGGGLRYSVGGVSESSKMLDVLSTSSNVKLIKENKLFNLYEIADSDYIPTVHYYSQDNGDTIGGYEEFSNDKSNTLEYKKINPTTYLICGHRIRGTKAIILNTSYHKDWQLTLKPYAQSKITLPNSSDYFIFNGNENDQMSLEELTPAILRHKISTLGNLAEKSRQGSLLSYLPTYDHPINFLAKTNRRTSTEKFRIDFISNEYANSIQNNNLEKTPEGIPAVLIKDHRIANGYVNSWVIDTNELCKDKQNCIYNEDGSYDVMLTAEYNPQKYFVLGLFCSFVTFILSLVYIVFELIIKRKL